MIRTGIAIFTLALTFMAPDHVSGQSVEASDSAFVCENGVCDTLCGDSILYDRIYAELDTLTLEQKAARMIIVGMRGTSLSDAVKRDIDLGAAGVILFEHNIYPAGKGVDSKERLSRLCAGLKEYAARPLIVAVDQEGGLVNRLKSKYGFPYMPSAAYLGGLDNADTTRYYGDVIAGAVAEAGFNVNFTPCVDLNVNPTCPVIGRFDRSFSADAGVAVRNASIIVEEHRKHGLATSLKHFPGHGSSKVDSHKGFTDITATWSGYELEPFRRMIDSGACDMMMVGHLYNSRIDSVYPATLSKAAIDGLLRGKLGFDGVVITDDMHMKAIADNYSLEESLRLTVEAGVDLIILSSNIPGHTEPVLRQAIGAICRLVRSGVIPESRLDMSIARVRLLMERTAMAGQCTATAPIRRTGQAL